MALTKMPTAGIVLKGFEKIAGEMIFLRKAGELIGYCLAFPQKWTPLQIIANDPIDATKHQIDVSIASGADRLFLKVQRK